MDAMTAGKDNDVEKQNLAKKNIRVAILLALLAAFIYCGYILTYYFK